MPEDRGEPATEAIATYARIRHGEGESEVSLVDGDVSKVRAKNLEFVLDHAFGTKANQEDVYNVIGRPLVQRVVQGYNAAVLAYGQTGSGKTFTMLGPESSKLDGTDEGAGIVPRACMQLFSSLPKGYKTTVSYVEVYNDTVNDLLGEGRKNLPLREQPPGHVEPEDLTREEVLDAKGVMASLAKGDKNRVVAPMAMNSRSSRGHGLICINVYNNDGEQYGRLTLVDLAGMESSKKSAPEGASNLKARQLEAKAINVSLLALSSVVSALASKGAMRIPFRNSKLTRLLQSSLAGNCKAAFCVTLRSELRNTEEAIGTLRFAQRAKTVQATVIKNQATKKPANDKALAGELSTAKNALAEFEAKLATSEKYSADLANQVQTLLGEMASLQRETELAKKREKMVESSTHQTIVHTIDNKAYVAQLERRVFQLEEENRVLRQRDIMHRLVELEPTGGEKIIQNKEDMATFDTFQPASGGFAQSVQDQSAEAEERIPKTKFEKLGYKKVGYKKAGERSKLGARGRKAQAKRRWRNVRMLANMVGSVKRVHPHESYGNKYKAPTKVQTKAATKIQAHWRGKTTREEQYWDLMYGDDYW